MLLLQISIIMLYIDLMHIWRHRRAPPRVGGQTRHCRVRHCQACSQRANPCMPYAAGQARARALTESQRSSSTARARSATSPDPQHGVVVYGDVTSVHRVYTALIWQKEASDKSDISRKRAKCVCHLHWRQWNMRMSILTYLLVGWVFLHEIWPGRRAHYVNYENINNSNLDGMSLASFCQSRAV